MLAGRFVMCRYGEGEPMASEREPVRRVIEKLLRDGELITAQAVVAAVDLTVPRESADRSWRNGYVQIEGQGGRPRRGSTWSLNFAGSKQAWLAPARSGRRGFFPDGTFRPLMSRSPGARWPSSWRWWLTDWPSEAIVRKSRRVHPASSFQLCIWHRSFVTNLALGQC